MVTPNPLTAQRVTNVVFAGLGGQGVLKASDILAAVAFAAGFDVKKSELHGMSQRGGSVTSDVRFGDRVFSPMIPAGEADFVVVLADEEVTSAGRFLRPRGVMITPDAIDAGQLPNKRSLNVALLGVLSRHLDIAGEHWEGALAAKLPAKVQADNQVAFALEREAADAVAASGQER